MRSVVEMVLELTCSHGGSQILEKWLSNLNYAHPQFLTIPLSPSKYFTAISSVVYAYEGSFERTFLCTYPTPPNLTRDTFCKSINDDAILYDSYLPGCM